MDKILRAYHGMRAYQKLPASRKKLTFYVESENYCRYVWPYIEYNLETHNNDVCYLTSSLTDPILKKK